MRGKGALELSWQRDAQKALGHPAWAPLRWAWSRFVMLLEADVASGLAEMHKRRPVSTGKLHLSEVY
ncbi:MAG: hypothetical protein RMN51_04615 [Verrucomicrobiota bacterium]|nr:hypothetical protein [Limisphaera sp.]MDW8381375.1 hypothetical protein [Verrucomicrobiota bacterium]